VSYQNYKNNNSIKLSWFQGHFSIVVVSLALGQDSVHNTCLSDERKKMRHILNVCVWGGDVLTH